MAWILWALLACIALLAAVCVARAARFRPAPTPVVAPEAIEIDEANVAERMAQLIRCKTVSNADKEKIDAAEFARFRQALRELFPRLHAQCPPENIGENGLLFHWKGKSAAEPSVFMAHYDVVPADEAAWQKPPFAGVLEAGVLWGRGTLDTKGTLFAALEAAERLLGEGFVPQNDVYFSFAGDEEIAGDDAPAIVSELERRNIRPAFVLDEGGAVVEGIFPGVHKRCAVVGTAEKGMLSVEFSLKSQGGHASAPPPHTPVGLLAQAVVRIEAKPFPAQLTPPAREMFDTLGRHSSFLYRLIFANLWCFRPVLDALCKKQGGELNALMRTTCAFTMMEGSPAPNVLPPQARVVANLRLLGEDTLDSAEAYLRRVARNDAIQLRRLYGSNPSRISVTGDAPWKRLEETIRESWEGALVSPYMMVACSDSRHFCRISDHVYRFSAMALSKEERGYIHGNDERIPIGKIADTVRFYLRLLRRS